MNIYKEFKKQNPGIKAIAKAAALKGDTANGYAGCLLADKAEQTAKACADLGNLRRRYTTILKLIIGTLTPEIQKQNQSMRKS
jgi:hypothetical protein